MGRSFTVDAMRAEDWPQVSRIYAEGLKSRIAAFLTNPPSPEKWHASHLPVGRLVAREAENVLGWAALSAAADT